MRTAGTDQAGVEAAASVRALGKTHANDQRAPLIYISFPFLPARAKICIKSLARPISLRRVVFAFCRAKSLSQA